MNSFANDFKRAIKKLMLPKKMKNYAGNQLTSPERQSLIIFSSILIVPLIVAMVTYLLS